MAQPTFFPTPASFRAWLERHHETAAELLVGFYRVDAGRPSMTWPESVDQALCFGWIDGVRKRRDDRSYTIRFTPRRPGSNWSAVNIAKIAELERQDLMRPAGRAAFARRTAAKSQIYAYEQRHEATLDPRHLARFESKRRAWAFFQVQPPSYRQTCIYWVATAKTEATRLRRLDRLIEASAAGRRL